MKLWLFDILACPIDKNFPLKLYIFSYETSNDKIRSILEIPINSNIDKLKSENVVIISQENGKVSVQDDLILEKTPLPTYLNLIKSSLEELENVQDLSGIESSRMLLEKIRTDIYTKLKKSIKNLPENNLDEILPELVMINKYKFETEIETGILYCPECKRWFPIIDTIPQMLPDEYRDEQAEIEFLKTNKNLLHKEFFQQDLKPFNI
jgi:uncharacterized protein YbaR (Trm112 family)